MKIELLEISGMVSALKALRLPYNKEPMSDINRTMYAIDGVFSQLNRIDFDLEGKDIALMQKLIVSGDEHAKPLRGILAYLDITAPIDWWVEAETYEAGHQRLFSASTLNTAGRRLTGHALREELNKISFGREVRKIDYISYQTLRRIVRQRYNHRKEEWHFFIDAVRMLPYAEELILVGLEDELKIHDDWMKDYSAYRI